MVSKLVLHCALQVRVLKSILISVILVPSDLGMYDIVKAQTKKFSETMKEMSDKDRARQPHGPAHRHAWNGVLLSVTSLLEKKANAELSTLLKDYCSWAQANPKLLDKELRHCCMTNAWRKDVKKLEVTASEGSHSEKLLEGIVCYLEKEFKAERKEGKAPQGDLERKIQAAIDDLEK